MSMKKREPQSIRSAKVTFHVMEEKKRAEKASKPLPLSTWMYKVVMDAVDKKLTK